MKTTDERLDEIKTKWNFDVTLPMAVPWGKDDVVWLVGEVERLRAKAEADVTARLDFLERKVQAAEVLADEVRDGYGLRAAQFVIAYHAVTE